MLSFQSASSVHQLTKFIQIPALSVHPSCPFKPTSDAVSNLIKQLRLICKWRFMTISERGILFDYIFNAENFNFSFCISAFFFFFTVKNTGVASAPLPRTYQELMTCELLFVFMFFFFISINNNNNTLLFYFNFFYKDNSWGTSYFLLPIGKTKYYPKLKHRTRTSRQRFKVTYQTFGFLVLTEFQTQVRGMFM